jgi:hypothetical protein
MKTVQECLATLAVSDAELIACSNLHDEFVCIKRMYREKVLASHPDKGGDPAIFLSVRASFEVLRDMYSLQRVKSFSKKGVAQKQTADTYDQTWRDFEGAPTPSWDFFYTADEEDVPLYKMELAKSGRSACKQTGIAAKKCIHVPPFIEKGELRIGSLNSDTGALFPPDAF